MQTRRRVASIVAAIGTAILLLDGLPAAAAALDSWTIVASQNLPGGLRTSLAATACLSSTDCWGVGEVRSATDYEAPLAEHWDGSSWTVARTPKPFAALNATLFGVACPSPSDCWAVGLLSTAGGGSAPLVEHWDGTAWTVAAVPLPDGEQYGGFRGITCVSASFCWAAGWWDGNGGFQTLLERWDGTSWSVVAGATLSVSSAPAFNDVACASQSECWAVGSYTSSANVQALIERWDGNAWVLAAAATPPAAAQSTDLTGVTCAAADMCVAVGSYTVEIGGTGQALIEQFDGATWRAQTPSDASPTTMAELARVTCPSSTLCYAAGTATPAGGSPSALLDAWSGGSWASAGNAGPGGAKVSQLSDIACAGICWTVGAQTTSAGFEIALVEQFSGGSFTLGTTEVPQGQELNAFSGVACEQAVCMAVGSHSTEAEADSLVETSSGGGWTVVTSASLGGGTDSFLNGVTCVSATDCWAVGEAERFAGNGPTAINTSTSLIERWDGSSWSIVSSPNPTGAQISNLESVSCVSARDCWAVGLFYPFADNGVTEGLNSTGPIAVAQTLIEQWNGSSWSIVTSNGLDPALSEELTSVNCVSVNDCWAVGAAEGAQTVEGLIERWNGSSWSVVTSPQTPGNQSSALFGVSCSGPAWCSAVGYSYIGSGGGARDFQTWVERWDGISWTTVASPNPGPDQVDALFAVTCASSTDCRAVGTYGNGPIYATLALQWDGNSWKLVPSENPSVTLGTFLYGVACSNLDLCWAAGTFNTADGTLQTLVEESGGAPVPAVPEVPWAPLLPVGSAALVLAMRTARRRAATRRAMTRGHQR